MAVCRNRWKHNCVNPGMVVSLINVYRDVVSLEQQASSGLLYSHTNSHPQTTRHFVLCLPFSVLTYFKRNTGYMGSGSRHCLTVKMYSCLIFSFYKIGGAGASKTTNYYFTPSVTFCFIFFFFFTYVPPFHTGHLFFFPLLVSFSSSVHLYPFSPPACVPSSHQCLRGRCWQQTGMFSDLLCRIVQLHSAWEDKGGQGRSITSPSSRLIGLRMGFHACSWAVGLAWSICL